MIIHKLSMGYNKKTYGNDRIILGRPITPLELISEY